MTGDNAPPTAADAGGSYRIDLAAVVVLVALAGITIVEPGSSPIQVALGLPLVLFLPGYAVISAAFPRREGGADDRRSGGLDRASDSWLAADPRSGIGIVGRISLSVVTSVALVGMLSLAVSFTRWGIRPRSLFWPVAAVTLVANGVAAVRRERLPADERFAIDVREWLAAAGARADPSSGRELLLAGLVVVSVVGAAAAVGYAATVPSDDERDTELYLLGENGEELVADEYPREFESGEPEPLHVGVENHEGERTEYTVVVQQVATDGDGAVQHRERLHGITMTADPGEALVHETAVAPTQSGENQRLVYLLYKGDPPDEPTTANAYRSVHVGIDVA